MSSRLFAIIVEYSATDPPTVDFVSMIGGIPPPPRVEASLFCTNTFIASPSWHWFSCNCSCVASKAANFVSMSAVTELVLQVVLPLSPSL